MNILIVDDEFYSVDWVKQKIEASAFRFDTIFTAHSMQEAQRIFSSNQVDILLTDIEMPKGSGLDLLEWVRTCNYQTICIFFTSHAEFEYASKALRLRSEDYLLKPIDKTDLLAALQKAAARVRQQEQEHLNHTYAQYWNDSQMQTLEHFWYKLAIAQGAPSQLMVLHELNALHLPESTLQQRFSPVLVHCLIDETAKWEDPLYEYAMKNILIEMLYDPAETPLLPVVGRHQYLVLLPAASLDDNALAETLAAKLDRTMHACSTSLPGNFHIFPGNPCDYRSLGDTCSALLKQAKNTIYEGNLLFLAASAPQEAEFPTPPWEHWGDLLLSQRVQEMEREALTYLESLRTNPRATRRHLISFHHDFLQIVYSFLDKAGALAHNLFTRNEGEALSEAACDAIDKMTCWVRYILAAATECLASIARSSDIITAVKGYIDDHIADELDRATIAAFAFLSPDYLSHLFTEKEGCSLTAYISTRRIHIAKSLLYKKDLTVRDVALRSGFQNISYFSKVFKRETGMTPQEFKRSRKRG